MVTEIEGNTERLTGRVEPGPPHGPLLGQLNGAGELIEARAPCGLCAWVRRHDERPEAFEARIIRDVTALAA